MNGDRGIPGSGHLEINRDKVLELQTTYVEAMRARSDPCTVTHEGREFVLLPGVFPPYLDSALMVRSMHIEPSDAVLDVGSGTGIIAVFAALKAQRVVATDINPAAVESIRANARRHGLEDRLTSVQAGLFPADGESTFNVVTFNPPYTDHPAADVAEQSVWDPGHVTVRRFLSGVGGILKPGGRFYLGWADFADLDFIEGLMTEHGAHFARIDEVRDDISLFVAYEGTSSPSRR